jgi:hypothetical protein
MNGYQTSHLVIRALSQGREINAPEFSLSVLGQRLQKESSCHAVGNARFYNRHGFLQTAQGVA